MFDGSIEVSEMNNELARPTGDASGRRRDWRAVDRELRTIAKRRCALDAEEARWLREAERLEIWRPLGMVSAFDYLERVLGYTPHTARERLRVARALDALPAISDAFAEGELSFSAVRELTRVATSETDQAWRDAAVSKSVREIEESVAGLERGAKPGDPPDPLARPQVVRFELRPDTYARLRDARASLAHEHGRYLDDDELIGTLCDAVLERNASSGQTTGRARYQVSMTICARCKQGWQHGAGAKLAVDEAAVERALCDAQHIGSIDAEVPARAHQDVPPATVRLVWHRDGGRCQTPGCRSARGLEIHHIVHRSDGGTHEPANLTLRCDACHRAHHEGKITIRGTAPDRLETIRNRAVTPPRDLGRDAVNDSRAGACSPQERKPRSEAELCGASSSTRRSCEHKRATRSSASAGSRRSRGTRQTPPRPVWDAMRPSMAWSAPRCAVARSHRARVSRRRDPRSPALCSHDQACGR